MYNAYYKLHNISSVIDYLGFSREIKPPDTEKFISRNWLIQLWTNPKSDGRGRQAGDARKSCGLRPKAICWQHSFLLERSKNTFTETPSIMLGQLDTVSQPS